MKFFLIAGEASGDLHASQLIASLRQRDPDARFTFLGGDMMAAAAGTKPVIHYRDMAYMGFVEVLRHLRQIKANFAAARRAIAEAMPDCLILVDYPSFNLKMAEYAKKLGIPVYYYIPPKIWAWKQWRVKTIRKVVDHVFAIFPFEVDFYRKHGYERVTYMGNPSVQEIDRALADLPSRKSFIADNHLSDKPILAILPGSRLGEIRENLNIMLEALRPFDGYQIVVSGAPGVEPSYYSQFTDLPVVFDQTYALLRHAHAALVTSGTATLEAALIGTPQVAMYQGGGSKMLYNIMKHLLKIPYVTLPNLIAGYQVVPELLMHLCTPQAATEALSQIIPDGSPRQAMLDGYKKIRQALGTANAADSAAETIVNQCTIHSS